MPDLDGVSVVRRMRADGLDVPVCILSARDEVDDRVAGLQAGADDYLVKPFAIAELTARLQALLRRRGSDGAGPARRRRPRRRPAPPRRHPRRPRPRASRAASSTCSRSSPAIPARCSRASSCSRQVWGYASDVETNVVDVFVGYVRRKLEADGEPRMLHTVRGVGWVLRP